MNANYLFRAAIATVAALVFLLTPTCPVGAYNQSDEERLFETVAAKQSGELNKLTKAVNAKVKDMNDRIRNMHFNYDEIMSLGPSDYRKKLVENYEYQRQVVYADYANMEPDLKKLTNLIPGCKRFRDREMRFKDNPLYKELNNALFDAQLAVVAANAVNRPGALPIPLPSEDVDSVEVIKATILAKGKLQYGMTYKCAVTVRCNRTFTGATAKIAVRVVEGPATLEEPTTQDVTLIAQEEKTITFKFTITGEKGGPVRIRPSVESWQGRQ